ncbi:MAG: hypothetical protein A3G38_02505 [Omnitrophica WOR_2 bacterium RIFCSPLOWO2_12_FULL_51_8]|nr:MAG: hypothetical protein A3G38_02505 [Omnitrophica WOR_2 bacterium RIFCSPLOWO2_12_FULL_51_8]
MRDLLFKNLTSSDKKRRIIATSEISDKEGVRSVIRRHFVCLIKEIKGAAGGKPQPYLYVLKERNAREQKERFFCRLKGSVYAISNDRLFLITFLHSLKINLSAIPHSSITYPDGDNSA